MFKVSRLLVTGVVISLAVAAHAEPNMPRRAKTLRVALVRAYAPCSGSVANDHIRDSGVSACATSQPLSTFKFGGQGRGTAQARMASTGDSFRLQLDLEDVRDAAGNPVDGSVSFTLEFTYRITTNHCQLARVCTTTTFVNRDTVAICANGSCHGHARVSLGVLGDPAFSSSIEIEPMQVTDPANNVFATQGTIAGPPQ